MSHDRHDRFDDAFKRWARRPPRTPPGEAAARLRQRLPPRRPRRPFAAGSLRLAAAAVGLVLVLGVAWLLSRPGPVAPPAEELAVPPLDENVVLLWLDRQTPLYLTVAPPAAPKGGSS